MRLRFLIIMILLSSTVTADLEIVLNSYSPDKLTALIQIQNTGDLDFTGVTAQIDDSNKKNIIGILRPSKAVVLIETLHPGEHKVTAIAKEGVSVTKILRLGDSLAPVESEGGVLSTQAQNLKNKKLAKLKKLQNLRKEIKVENQKDASVKRTQAVTAQEQRAQQIEEKKIVTEDYVTPIQQDPQQNLIILALLILAIIVGVIYYINKK